MNCKKCNTDNDSVKIAEYFDQFAVALCVDCYSEWISHYSLLPQYREYRDALLEVVCRRFSAKRDNSLIPEYAAADKVYYEKAAKMAQIANLYFGD